MATTTFEKTITLNQEAADNLADILEKPAPPTFWPWRTLLG